MGLSRVPCIRLDHMTDSQRRAYALAHNKTAELSEWDFGKLDEELARLQIEEIGMGAFDFDMQNADWFDRQEKDGGDEEEGNDEYNEFLHKFEGKKTTDDCYTPENIYDAVADWVAEEYGLSRRQFVRPFYPGGDYKSEKYPKGAVVVDNPPFSILAEIIKFYNANNVKFFLFAPTLTLFTATGGGRGVRTLRREGDLRERRERLHKLYQQPGGEPDIRLRGAVQARQRAERHQRKGDVQRAAELRLPAGGRNGGARLFAGEIRPGLQGAEGGGAI